MKKSVLLPLLATSLLISSCVVNRNPIDKDELKSYVNSLNNVTLSIDTDMDMETSQTNGFTYVGYRNTIYKINNRDTYNAYPTLAIGTMLISMIENRPGWTVERYIEELEEEYSEEKFQLTTVIDRANEKVTISMNQSAESFRENYYKYDNSLNRYEFFISIDGEFIDPVAQEKYSTSNYIDTYFRLQKELVIKAIDNGEYKGSIITYKLSNEEKQSYINSRVNNTYEIPDTLTLTIQNNKLLKYEIANDINYYNQQNAGSGLGNCTSYKETYTLKDVGSTSITFPNN